MQKKKPTQKNLWSHLVLHLYKVYFFFFIIIILYHTILLRLLTIYACCLLPKEVAVDSLYRVFTINFGY